MAVSYHCILSPVAVKSAIVEAEQKVCSESPVGASGAVTLIVTYSLQVTPLVVTSTQYSVVSVGITVIVDSELDNSYNLNVTTLAPLSPIGESQKPTSNVDELAVKG